MTCDASAPAGLVATAIIAAVAVRAQVAVLHADRDFDALARHTELQLYDDPDARS